MPTELGFVGAFGLLALFGVFAYTGMRIARRSADPFLRLLTDLQPDLAEVSLHFRSDPKTVGGSLFRIYRDARFSNDKSPYKSWQGARLFHERHKQVPAPSFYLHLQPGECFVGAGLWHPEPDTQRRVRQ